jgi:hypothetical protein
MTALLNEIVLDLPVETHLVVWFFCEADGVRSLLRTPHDVPRGLDGNLYLP